MKFSIKDFISKCDQIRSLLRIWSHLLKKSLMGNFTFCAVQAVITRIEEKILVNIFWEILFVSGFTSNSARFSEFDS